MGDAKVESDLYCRCGGMMSVRLRGFDAERVAAELAGFFWDIHAGAEHGPTTAQIAAAARRRSETDVADRLAGRRNPLPVDSMGG